MSTEAALLAAVVADPDADAPRLVLADWYEEHGDPDRAEFIRVECEAARTDRDSPAYPRLLRRADELSANAGRWFGPLWEGGAVEHAVTRRGFVDAVSVSAAGFAARAEDIFTHAPLLREVHVTAAGDWRAFFAVPQLRTIRALSFREDVFEWPAAGELAGCRHLNALAELELDRQPLSGDDGALLAGARLPRLDRLTLAGCGGGPYWAAALFQGDGLGTVRELDLSENELTDAACRALAQATRFDRLERLYLCHNRISAAGVAALADAKHLARLRHLNLYGNPIGPDGGRAILLSRHLGRLEDLNLTGCGVGVAVVNDLRWRYGDRAVKA